MPSERSSSFYTRSGVLLALGALVLVLLPLQTNASTAGAAKRAIAHVRYIKRGLTVWPPHQRSQTGHVKMPLFGSYLLRTKRSQRASLNFPDRTLLHLNSNTDVVLRSPNLTYVQRGQVVQVQTPGSTHQVQTATAVASAIGTAYQITVSQIKSGLRTTFEVIDGSLKVQNAHGSVYVGTDEQTTVTQKSAPQPPTPVDAGKDTSWIGSIPPPDQPPGENLALADNGGHVVAYSSQAEPQQVGPLWNADYLIDGRLDFGWSTAVGAITNQWVKIGFLNNQTRTISSVVIDPAATHGHPSNMDLKHFQIRVSTTGTDDASFRTVYQGTAARKDSLQTFTLPSPVSAKYIELRALDNYGSPERIDVAELEAVANPKSSIVPPYVVPTPCPNPLCYVGSRPGH